MAAFWSWLGAWLAPFLKCRSCRCSLFDVGIRVAFSTRCCNRTTSGWLSHDGSVHQAVSESSEDDCVRVPSPSAASVDASVGDKKPSIERIQGPAGGRESTSTLEPREWGICIIRWNIRLIPPGRTAGCFAAGR
eukprot:scaffold262014_cov31-Tisochrysis_lutea.AAC.2